VGGGRCFRHLDEIPVHSFKFVTMWGVLEHLVDPIDVVSSISELLSSTGILVLTTVNAEGVIPYHYKPPEHLTYWTRNSLEYLGLVSGLQLVSLVPYTMLQLTTVYLDRILSRSPLAFQELIKKQILELPEIIEIPTNEFIAVFKK
jgi:2-polyprenyl-3-methyl-5-hydroxy-6-metoxy-1,4-benzoquinol methylase